MAVAIAITHVSIAVVFYLLGKWRGYLDAQPKRSKNGRFIKD